MKLWADRLSDQPTDRQTKPVSVLTTGRLRLSSPHASFSHHQLPLRLTVAGAVKNLSADAEDVRDTGSVPGPGTYPGRGNGNPLQYPCLKETMDRGVWWAAVHRVTKSWTRLKQLSTHARLRLTATLNSLSAGSFCLHLDTA